MAKDVKNPEDKNEKKKAPDTQASEEGTDSAALKEQEVDNGSAGEGEDVKPASFDEIESSQEKMEVKKGDGAGGKGNNIERILDIPITISAELGRTRMVINNLLQLGHGSVIELDKIAGEPMEILVNDKLVARGEVVVVNEKYGVRLTEIVSPVERIKQLK